MPYSTTVLPLLIVSIPDLFMSELNKNTRFNNLKSFKWTRLFSSKSVLDKLMVLRFFSTFNSPMDLPLTLVLSNLRTVRFGKLGSDLKIESVTCVSPKSSMAICGAIEFNC